MKSGLTVAQCRNAYASIKSCGTLAAKIFLEHWILVLRGQTAEPRFKFRVNFSENCGRRSGTGTFISLSPRSFDFFPLLITIPPLIPAHLSPYDSPDQASRDHIHRLLVWDIICDRHVADYRVTSQSVSLSSCLTLLARKNTAINIQQLSKSWSNLLSSLQILGCVLNTVISPVSHPHDRTSSKLTS